MFSHPFSCIVISTFTLCLRVAHNLTMKTAWIILLCLHCPDVCIDMNLMIGILKERKLKLLSSHNVKHTATMFSMICHWMFFSKNVNMDKKCLIFNRRLLSHSRTMKCAVCYNNTHHISWFLNDTWHVKCISLDNDERSNILRDAHSWFCSLRLISKFPINHIEDDSDFSKAICTKDNLKLGELHFSDKISKPMEILDREMNIL